MHDEAISSCQASCDPLAPSPRLLDPVGQEHRRREDRAAQTERILRWDRDAGAEPGQQGGPGRQGLWASLQRAELAADVAEGRRAPADTRKDPRRPTGFSDLGINIYTGVKTGRSNNDLIVSTSTDGARTFSGGTVDPRQIPVATDSAGQATSSQFWQDSAFGPDGTFAVTCDDRQYGNDETTGYSDISFSIAPRL